MKDEGNSTGSDAPAPFSYRQEDNSAPVNQSTDQTLEKIEPVTWSASEFIAHEKQLSWYLILGAGAIFASAVTYLVTKDMVPTVIIIIVAAIFGYYAAHRPNSQNYTLDEHSVTIGQHSYPYNNFKSFSIMEEDAFRTITLMPMKRFMPSLSLYYPPEQEEQIVTTLSYFLPHEMRKHDSIDRLMHKIRF